MRSTTQRRIFITATVLILATIGAAAYLFLFRPSGPARRPMLNNLPIIGGRAPAGAPTPPPAELPGTKKPGEGETRLRQIITKDILAPTLSADTKSLYYIDRSNGHMLKSDLDGNGEETLTNLTILEAFDAVWSPAKTKAAISYHERGIVKRFINETATSTPSRFLPPDVRSFAWSPDGTSVAYLVPQGANTNLIIADQLKRGGRIVYATPVPDFNVQWVSQNMLLLVSRPSGLAPSLVMRFDLSSRHANPLLLGTRGIIALPLPDGGGFIFSQSSERGEAQPLARYSFKDGTVTALNVTTLAEKCAVAANAKKLYCGVPRGTIQTPSPDEWYRGAVALSDTILAVDALTGQAAAVLEDMPGIDVVAPFLSADERFLFFQDKQTGTLWRLAL